MCRLTALLYAIVICPLVVHPKAARSTERAVKRAKKQHQTSSLMFVDDGLIPLAPCDRKKSFGRRLFRFSKHSQRVECLLDFILLLTLVLSPFGASDFH